ncbi:hypothetical protein PHYPSEUDO_001394 [Phytophthora pseudosyringae]|uniref:Uncharacterized protein n=1 Tax=Phytophthora pseudosyringae TaxID=221518 RepID=A0A8T1WJT2_9STRA|nr:hypothetical protein PHYPSEUDO_001394 [Phytophthora pseudosyringae]
MNIYHQSLLEGRPFLKPSTPDVSSGTITSSSELSALLQLVIPGSDVLFPPIDMARSNNYHPIEHPSPSFMYQLSALSLPISPQHQAPLVVPYDFWWGVASPAAWNGHVISSDVEVTYTAGEPLFDSACSWIEPVPFVFPDPVISTRVPHPSQVGALVTPLEPPTNEFALSLPENDKKKLSQPKQPRDECEVAGCNTKKQSNGRQWVGANAMAEVHAAKSTDARQVAKVEGCAAHMVVASCAPLLVARKVPSVKENVPRIPRESAASRIACVSPVAEACAPVTRGGQRLHLKRGNSDQRSEPNNSIFSYSTSSDALDHSVQRTCMKP